MSPQCVYVQQCLCPAFLISRPRTVAGMLPPAASRPFEPFCARAGAPDLDGCRDGQGLLLSLVTMCLDTVLYCTMYLYILQLSGLYCIVDGVVTVSTVFLCKRTCLSAEV